MRGELPPSTASPPRATPAQQRSRAIFERVRERGISCFRQLALTTLAQDCLPLRITGLNPLAPVYTPSSPPAAMETAELGGIENERMPEDGGKSPERFDDAGPPPAAAAAPSAASAARPPGYKSSEAVQRTRRCALKKALGKKHPELLEPIQELVVFTSLMGYHVKAVLQYFGDRLCRAAVAAPTPAARAKVFKDAHATMPSFVKGELFETQLIQNAYILVQNRIKSGPPPPPPPPRATRGNTTAAPPARTLMQQVADDYFSNPEVAAELDALKVPEAYTSDIYAQAAPIVVQNFGDIFKRNSTALQRLMLRLVHNLTAKEAKEVQKRLPLFKSGLLAKALTMDTNLAKRKVYLAEAAEMKEREASEAADAALHELKQKGASRAAIADAELEAKVAADALKIMVKAHCDAKAELASWAGKLSEAVKVESLHRLHTTPFAPRKKRAAAASEEDEVDAPELRPLLEILEEEIEELPEKERQDEGLMLRYRMRQRIKAALDAADAADPPAAAAPAAAPDAAAVARAAARALSGRPPLPKPRVKVPRAKGVKGTLLPGSRIGFGFVHCSLETLCKLLDGKGPDRKTARTGDNTVNARIWELCEAPVLKHLLSGWPRIGPIFKTDGVQLQLTVENDPKLEKKEAATKKQKATKKKLATGAVPEEVEEQEAEVTADTKLRNTTAGAMVIEAELPPGAIVTTMDGGLHNVYGAARTKIISMEEISAAVNDQKPFFKPADKGERVDGGTWVLTTASIRHATRSRQRAFNLQRRLRRLRKTNSEFAAAEAVWESSNINTTDAAELVAALKARGAVVHLMIKGYEGHNGHGFCFHLARAKFDASIAKEAVLIKEARRLVPTELHFVAWGDAMFDSTLKGSAAGCFFQLCRWLEILFPNNILRPVPEGRTSMLDPVHHWCARLARARAAPRRLGHPQHAGICAPASRRCALRRSSRCLAARADLPLSSQPYVESFRRLLPLQRRQDAAVPCARASPRCAAGADVQRALEPRHRRRHQHERHLLVPLLLQQAARRLHQAQVGAQGVGHRALRLRAPAGRAQEPAHRQEGCCGAIFYLNQLHLCRYPRANVGHRRVC